ncbi:MAG: substrate-binding domain-containing protein [Armatimonadetes bacterium]|nr:substrate-binding domain-containing protein [Armatimonadota bacterium]
MTTSSRIILMAALAAFWLAGCQPAPKPDSGSEAAPTSAAAPQPAAAPAGDPAVVTVFVPCGMIDAFRAVEKAYPAGGGDKLKVTYDNAVVLLKKIRAGERPDVLVSPGRLEMNMMEQEKFVDAASVVNFGTFKMIVVTPKNNPAGIQSY